MMNCQHLYLTRVIMCSLETGGAEMENCFGGSAVEKNAELCILLVEVYRLEATCPFVLLLLLLIYFKPVLDYFYVPAF